MGSFVDMLFELLLGWVRALVSSIWALFTTDRMTILEFFGKHWIAIALVLVVIGLVVDWLIWLVRWQPYRLWGRKRAEPDEDDEDDDELFVRVEQPQPAPEPGWQEAQSEWFAPRIDEEQAQAIFARAESAPDEHVYPGMRYGSVVETPSAEQAAAEQLAAEQVAAEQLAAEQVAAEQLAAEQAAAEQLAAEQVAAEQLAAEQAAAEQAAAEEARLAQEEYERQMAEYERQKAQYELDLAEYQRKQAEYEAQMAALNAEGAEKSETRRRQIVMPEARPKATGERPRAASKKAPQKTQTKKNGLFRQMAKMLETEEEQMGIHKLPPRVSQDEAYHPAKRPGTRRRGQ